MRRTTIVLLLVGLAQCIPQNLGAESSSTTASAWSPISTADAPIPSEEYASVWTGHELIVWRGNEPGEAGRYDPAHDAWAPLSSGGGPTARRVPIAVWTGTEMIIWGGTSRTTNDGREESRNDGARYNPLTDTWAPTSLEGAPSARVFPAVVWTGKELLIWGGSAGLSGRALNDGAAYDPSTDAWRALPSDGRPSPLYHPSHVWTGREMLIWGRLASDRSPYYAQFSSRATGASYDPEADVWTSIPSAPSDPSHSVYSATWTGTEMVLWDGLDGGRYDPTRHEWHTMSSQTGVPDRQENIGHLIWSGRELIMWGGRGGTEVPRHVVEFNNGSRYDPTTDTWCPILGGNGPASGFGPSTWTGDSMLIWPGRDRVGGIYRPYWLNALQETMTYDTSGRPLVAYSPARRIASPSSRRTGRSLNASATRRPGSSGLRWTIG